MKNTLYYGDNQMIAALSACASWTSCSRRSCVGTANNLDRYDSSKF